MDAPSCRRRSAGGCRADMPLLVGDGEAPYCGRTSGARYTGALMTDLGLEIAASVRADWDDERARAVAIRLRLRRRRRAVSRVAMVLLATSVVFAATLRLWRRHPMQPVPIVTHAVPTKS